MFDFKEKTQLCTKFVQMLKEQGLKMSESQKFQMYEKQNGIYRFFFSAMMSNQSAEARN